MGKCMACGGDVSNNEKDDLGSTIYRCKNTGRFGCGCAECGTTWHTSTRPFSGETINCPKCGNDYLFRHGDSPLVLA